MLSSDKTFNYELNKENLINILNKNFFFDVVNDETFGKMVKLHPYDAFSLSLVHGAPYLVNEAGFSLKGRFEVLIHRGVFQNNRYIYTPGLFGRKLDRTLCAGESPYYIKKRFPQIFKGEKYVLFIDIPKNSSSNIEKKIYDELKKRTDPSNYLLIKNFEGGSNLEPFFEYLCCLMFNQRGYLTENQVPWFQQKFPKNGKMLNGGIPDFNAFKTPFIEEMIRKGIFTRGMVIQELSNLFTIEQGSSLKFEKPSKNKYELILAEVKTSKSQRKAILPQLEQYIEADLCDKAYGVLYDEDTPLSKTIGLINLDYNFKINMTDASEQLSVDTQMQNDDEKWLKGYMKFYLLANLSIDKIIKFINLRRKNTGKFEKDKLYSYDLIEAVINCPDEELIDFVLFEVDK